MIGWRARVPKETDGFSADASKRACKARLRLPDPSWCDAAKP
jgi:hypothetical protein